MNLHNDIKVMSNAVLVKLLWNSYCDDGNERGKSFTIRNGSKITSFVLRVTSLMELMTQRVYVGFRYQSIYLKHDRYITRRTMFVFCYVRKMHTRAYEFHFLSGI